MTTPQVHLIMLGLGLLAYVLITGFRSSRTSISRQHRRRWWLGTIAGTAVALSPLSQFWRKPFNSIDLLTQSFFISGFCLLALLIFSLLLTPYKALRRVFRRRRESVEHMLTRNEAGLSPIPINAESNIMLDPAPVAAMEGPDPLHTMFAKNTGEKSIAETINEAGDIQTDIQLAKPANVNEQLDQNVDQAATNKLDTTDIESVVPLHGKTDSTQKLNKGLSGSTAANDKIGIAERPLEKTIKNASQTAASQREDQTLRLDDVGDDTLRLDDLTDDTLRLDELLPNGEMPANSEDQAKIEQQIVNERAANAIQQANDELLAKNEQLVAGELPPTDERETDLDFELEADDEIQAEEMLLAEDGQLAEEELDIASIPSDEESFDLSDTGNLFSEIRSQQTELELPDDEELREASQASAAEELDLDAALLKAEESQNDKVRANDSQLEDIEEADVIDNSAELGADETDLEFGNDLTGEYAHPTDEIEQAPEQTIELPQVAEQIAEEPDSEERTIKRVAKLPTESEPTTEQVAAHDEDKTEQLAPEQDVLVVHQSPKEVAEPKTLAAALVAAKLTAESVESQVSDLENRIAKLDGFRNASISSANTNAEQHTVALEQTSVLLTCEDEARQAAESVINAQKAMLERAKQQQAEVDALLAQERKHLKLLKSEVERSRKMARTAALLARKAAVAQQEIRNVAKREQTARLKSEESTRKAVNIARNAINALAEEERKRDLTQH